MITTCSSSNRFRHRPRRGLRFYELLCQEALGGLSGSWLSIKALLTPHLDDFELNIIVEESIVIYPNPTSNKINIEFGLLSNNDLVVKIWDVKGNLIYVKDNNNSSLCLDTSSLTKGLYQIEISDNSNLIKRKILIQ